MASTSIQNSPSRSWVWKYEVFLSFRGDDTRNSFIDHLFADLHRRTVITFKDDVSLAKGKDISEELFKAIEESQVFIVVLSRNYATSTWCLEELTKIVDCIEQADRNQTILPVFYDVDPSEVRKQTGNYGKAFAQHEETFRNLDKVKRWRKALSNVGNLSGWDVRDKPEALVIKEIVNATTSKLHHKFSNIADDLVGIESRLEVLYKRLALSLVDVRYIGIVGMGGIGKTTLATVLFGRIYHYFSASSFLENICKVYDDDGLINLQKQLLSETLPGENMRIWNLHIGTNLISTKLRCLRCLIVLDNVDQSYQLEKLVGKPEWFGPGSLIIITTRDEHVLKEYGVDLIYKVEPLNTVEDLQLFCRKAFKCDDPLKDYEELTYRIVKYAKGLPLAIKVLGSFLFGRSVLEWESAFARLQENPKKEIIDVLRTSFDGLEATEKEMFLDIACYLNGQFEQFVRHMLDLRGFHPEIGMRILIDKSLIDIIDKKVRVHDLLRKLARRIVTEKLPNEPGKWSRLWKYEHLHHIMERNLETEDVEVIFLSKPCPSEMKLGGKILSKINRLRILKLNGMKISGNLVGLSREIQYLGWRHYPGTYLPHPFTRSASMFQLNRLVELLIPYSCSKQLWKGIEPLNNIRYLDLSFSRNLIKTPDFRVMPNLQYLLLKGCTSLKHVDESIGVLSKLEVLNLTGCTSLVRLPSSISRLTSLRHLHVGSCSNLKNPFEETSVADCLKETSDAESLKETNDAESLKEFMERSSCTSSTV